MPRVMRRTPATEEALSYGLGDLMREIVGRTVRETREGFRRPLDLSNEALLEMALAGVGAGTKILRGLGKGRFPFSVKTTDVPFWDAILKKPAYHKEAKGIERRIEFMSPEEYFGLVEKKTGFARDVGRPFAAIADPGMVRKYAEAMRKGAKFPMPGLEYKGRGRSFGQEGRHRVLAAGRLGITRIPVLVMRTPKKSPQEKLMERFSREGLKYDAFVEPIPGSPKFDYHQWTLYGEGPAKGATFGTKTTDLAEMERKIASVVESFSPRTKTVTGLLEGRVQTTLDRLKNLRLMGKPEVDEFIKVRERSIGRALRDLTEIKGSPGAEVDVNTWLRRTMRDIDILKKGGKIRYE